MNFVMTGHRGLIGTFLMKKLKEKGDKPVLLVDKREERDIVDMSKFKLEERADMLIHLASFCKINQTIENPELAFQNNALGTYRVMEFCRKNNIPKIVFTSSSRILSKEKNPYTASKIYGEELVRGYSDCYGLDFTIIRPSTVYGPFNDKTKRLMDVFMLNALEGKELKIFGDRNKTLDFTYIDDFVDGTLLAMAQRNEDYDISGGRGVRVDYVADLIISLAGKGRKVFCPAEKAQPQEVCLDINKLERQGYVPRVSIEEGVRRTFDWYKENFEQIKRERAE